MEDIIWLRQSPEKSFRIFIQDEYDTSLDKESSTLKDFALNNKEDLSNKYKEIIGELKKNYNTNKQNKDFLVGIKENDIINISNLNRLSKDTLFKKACKPSKKDKKPELLKNILKKK